MEPHVNPKVKWALYCPEAGIASPYEYVVALAENAIANGVEFELDKEVGLVAVRSHTKDTVPQPCNMIGH